jgi:SpoVK/Ycf46/Vps4 family AAA+-type ATPase
MEVPVSFAEDSPKQKFSVKDIAARVDPVWTFDTLGVPRVVLDVLREISAQVSDAAGEPQRGETAAEVRGSGTVALFAGENSKGKAAAAEALSHELRLPLYRIDLSHLARSGYIGETEKSLIELFPPVQTSWPILLFDEGDALFGKRTKVTDSHDRYEERAAILARQMQDYPGLILVTARNCDDMDSALMSCLTFTVQFFS